MLVRRASLHLGELVNCRWVEEVTQQLDTLQLQSPGRTVDAAHKDVLVDVLVSFLSRCMECRHGLATRILSVCMHCDKTEERSVQNFIPYERSFSLVF